MKTFLDTQHIVNVFYCRPHAADIHFWTSIIEILEPVTAFTKFRSHLVPGIYDNELKDWVAFHGLEFTKKDLVQWANPGNDRFQFDRITASFPSIKKCHSDKITPDIFIKCSIKPTATEKRYDLVFMLVLKKTFSDSLIAADTDHASLIRKLAVALNSLFQIEKTRPWALETEEYSYTDSLEDFFPSIILKKEESFTLSKEYTDWHII